MSNFQTTTTTNITPLIRYDNDYVNSTAGLIKIIVIIIDLAGFIVAQFASPASSTGFYGFTSMSAFWISIALFIAYTFHIVERLYHFHWLLAEFAFSLIYSLFFFVASLLLLISGGVATVTSIFGFVSGAIYAYEAKSSYLKYSNGEIAQGERITPQTMA